MSKQEYKQFIISMVLIVLILSSALGYIYITDRNFKENIPKELKHVNKINTLLKVSVYDSEGKLKSYLEKPDDLLTAQFINFLGAWFKGSSTSAYHGVSLKNDANADKTIKLLDDQSNLVNFLVDSSTGTSKKGGLVGIGTGSTAPARSNYSLETKVEAYSDISSAPTWDATAGTISLSGNVAITGSRTITEAILGVRWIDSAGSDQVFILARDTFAGQAVVNTDVVAVAYVITLTGAEFTTNFGEWLTAILTTVSDGGSKSVGNLKDTGNNARTVYTYNPTTYTSTFNYYPNLEYLPYSRIKIGTSSGALSRASYELTATIQEYAGYYTQTDTTGITINTAIPCRSSTTINEIGLYFTGSNSEYQFLMLRILTGGDAVTASDAYLIEIRIDC